MIGRIQKSSRFDDEPRTFLLGDNLIFLRLRSRTRVQLRAALCGQMPILCRAAKNRRRKGTKGSNTPWNPVARKVVPLSLHSFFRESKHLQLLRAWLKESHAHGSCTHAKQQKILLSATHPSLTKFQTKTLPAARVGCAASKALKNAMSWSFMLALLRNARV